MINAGWLVIRIENQGLPGLPDMLCVRKGEVAFIELKSGSSARISEAQMSAISSLAEAGADIRIVHWNDGDLVEYHIHKGNFLTFNGRAERYN